ncbi:hypothetical protein HAX54_038493, partial [Datura stramonium]|nr:hypothetical protein [Datura stramonium]
KLKCKVWTNALSTLSNDVGDLENVFVEVNEEVDYGSAIIPPRVNDPSFKNDRSIYTMLKAER